MRIYLKVKSVTQCSHTKNFFFYDGHWCSTVFAASVMESSPRINQIHGMHTGHRCARLLVIGARMLKAADGGAKRKSSGKNISV